MFLIEIPSRRWQSTGCSAYFKVECYRPLLTFSCLKLHRVAFIEVLDLTSRGETSAVKKHILASVVGSDEAVPFLPQDFLDCSSHAKYPPVYATRGCHLPGPA